MTEPAPVKIPKPTRKPVKFWVSCLPEDHPAAHLFTLRIEYKGGGKWHVTDGRRYLDAAGRWSYRFGWNKEPVTTEEMRAFEQGYEAWMEAHLFDLDTASRIAEEHAPRMTFGRRTVADALANPESS